MKKKKKIEVRSNDGVKSGRAKKSEKAGSSEAWAAGNKSPGITQVYGRLMSYEHLPSFGYTEIAS